MLELVSSKVVSAVAVLVLAGSVLGFFQIEKGAMEEARFRELADRLGGALDTLSTMSSGLTLNISFDGARPGLRLDGSFRGDTYDIELRPGQVILRQKGLTAVNALVQEVHLWDPRLLGNGTLFISASGLLSIDSDKNVLRLRSGEDLVAERAMMVVAGTPLYQTFVHI
jgi:hypothetical protein